MAHVRRLIVHVRNFCRKVCPKPDFIFLPNQKSTVSRRNRWPKIFNFNLCNLQPIKCPQIEYYDPVWCTVEMLRNTFKNLRNTFEYMYHFNKTFQRLSQVFLNILAIHHTESKYSIWGHLIGWRLQRLKLKIFWSSMITWNYAFLVAYKEKM